MKRFEWDTLKNQKLKDDRSITFDQVIEIISGDLIIDVVDNPNKKRYPNQKVFIILINNYIHCVPFVEDEEKIFLKTIFASRKYHKKYYKK